MTKDTLSGTEQKDVGASRGLGAAELERLIERCEGAVGPDRELDAAIALLVGYRRKGAKSTIGISDGYVWAEPGEHFSYGTRPPSYTASIDAALTLLPEGWRLYGLSDQTHFQSNKGWHAGVDCYFGKVLYPHNIQTAEAPTAPLAICIASLRARLTAQPPALADHRTPGTVEVCRMLNCACKFEYQWSDCVAANCPIRSQGGDTEGGATIDPVDALMDKMDAAREAEERTAPQAEAAPDEIAEIEKRHKRDETGVESIIQCHADRATLLQAIRRPQPAPMWVDIRQLGDVITTWFHASPNVRETSLAEYIIASGVVGKALPTQEQLRNIISERVLGHPYESLYTDKREAIDDRYAKFDCNYPHKCDVDDAVDAIKGNAA